LNISKKARRAIGKAVLQGPVLDKWMVRQYRRIDRAYTAELIRSSTVPVSAAPRPKFRNPKPVRHILLIADCMWEQNELVPDLQRQWQVSMLDLRPLLKKEQGRRSEPEIVTGAVADFISAQKTLEPDVILFYARSTLLSDEVFDHLRKRWTCPLFGMNLDDKATFFRYGVFSAGDENYQSWAGKFDLNLTNTLASVDWYHQRGFPCIYSPQGVNLPDDLPAPGPKPNFEFLMSFVGSVRVERRAIIDRLRELDIPITLFGGGWPGTQWADSPTRIYRSTQINLGIGFCTTTQTQTTVKGRDFECPGVGACYLTTYNWELTNHFEMGKEILCYRSVEELVEVYAYYRKRPEECLKIAQAAFRRSKAEHTWRKRFEKIFRETGIT
jgi:hypothetical protein